MANLATSERAMSSGQSRQQYSNNNSCGRGCGVGRSAPSSQSSNKGPCQVCYRYGHSALTYHHLFDHSFQGENAPSALIAAPSVRILSVG